MPVSQGSAGGIPGLNLKAWAYVTAAGALIRGFNVTSVAKGGAGAYTINFTAAMASADFVARFTAARAGGVVSVSGLINTATTGSATVFTCLSGAAGDVGGLWEFYE